MHVIYVILTLSEKFDRGSNECNICNIEIMSKIQRGE